MPASNKRSSETKMVELGQGCRAWGWEAGGHVTPPGGDILSEGGDTPTEAEARGRLGRGGTSLLPLSLFLEGRTLRPEASAEQGQGRAEPRRGASHRLC